MIRVFLLLFVTTLHAAAWAQSLVPVNLPLQTIRGTVRDADTDRPLPGATVSIDDNTQVDGSTTDANGSFRFPKMPVGRYVLLVSFVGYDSQIITELFVESGKEQVVDVRLRPGMQALAETVVKGTRPDQTLTSAQTITPEQILRFPATYLDPARLATSFAGIVNTNDQANNLSVRGNSPNGLIWRLEGIEIVNPNHLSNAGTLGDRPLPSGGGVSILSAQVLGTTRFLSGAFTPEYGNTLAGIMDMRFRTGNNEQHEFTAQAGLIGLDLAAEGPLNRTKGSSYLVNYRYSFTGLLGLLGISFGGERIQFQDISFNVLQPTRRGRLTVFGLAGSSRNDFTAKVDSLRIEDKDRYGINFDSRMVAGGLTYTQSFSDRWRWEVSAVASAGTNNRYQSPAAGVGPLPGGFLAYQRDRNTNGRATLHNRISYRLDAQRRLTAGLYLTRWYGSIGVWRDRMAFLPPPRNGVVQDAKMWAWLIQPYVNYAWTPSERLTINAGLHGNLFTYNKNSLSVEPRLSVRWQATPNQSLAFAYGLHSQTQQPVLYLSQVPGSSMASNQNVGLTKAHHFVASYAYQLSETASLKAEAYYQALFAIPVAEKLQNSAMPPQADSFCAVNLLDINEFAENPYALVNTGRGRNMGLELTYQKLLAKNYYLLLTGSLYDSKYRTLDGVWRDTRFNGRHALNLTGGKEFMNMRGGRPRVWGINAKLTQLGGFLDRPIDTEFSRREGRTVYQGQTFSVRQPEYFRTDLRVYWKKSRTRYSRTLSLDLLNVTNAQNASFSYYDALKGQVVQKYQLGLLPLLNYRWEF